MRPTRLYPLLLLFAACGRADVSALGSASDSSQGQLGEDSGPRDVPWSPGDCCVDDRGLPPGRDSGHSPWDGGPPPDPDGGECFEDWQCYQIHGDPVCNGAAGRSEKPSPPPPPGSWRCDFGRCLADCRGEVACQTDCDCPFEQACAGTSCQFLNRPNMCCFNPDWCGPQPGHVCVQSDGTQGRCPRVTHDAGVRPDGGGPVRDAAVDGGKPPRRDGGTSPDGGASCASDCDCARGNECQRGRCLEAPGTQNSCCTFGCPPGGSCTDPNGGQRMCPPSPTLPPGSACTDSTECGADSYCVDEQNGFPGGYCIEECGRGSTCPGDGVCRSTGQGMSYCFDGCQSGTDCRMGYDCLQVGVGSGRVCWPAPGGSMNPMGAPVGSACQGDNECVTGLTCFDPGGQSFPDGYCTVETCDPMSRPCPMGSQCFAFPGLTSLCLANCASGGEQSTCRSGYYCLGARGQPGVCVGN